MSRVDEALRRAASPEGTGPEHQPAPEATGFEMEDVAMLSRTPYPLELPRSRQRREVLAQPPAAPSEPVPERVAHESPAGTRARLLERIDPRLAQKVVVDQRLMPVSREQYRRLAAALHHAQSATGIKLVMIASALSGEGKTLTATNLALTFSESYQRNVLLIDGDLRKPGLHSIFGLDNSFGLSDGLAAVNERRLPVHQVSPLLSVLPAGRPNSDPMAGLTSERMRRILTESREGFDWVVIDTPPVGFLSDANLLSQMVDTAILVVKAGITPYDLVQRAIEAVGRERVIGAVLNRADPHEQATGYDYYGKYYAQQTTA